MTRKKQIRGKNEGSIYEEGGAWRGAISIGHGKYKRFRGATRAEVARKLNDLLSKKDKGLKINLPERLTVAAYLNNWLRETVLPGNPNTYSFYEGLCRLHIIPMLGKKMLVQLTPTDVRTLLNERRSTGMSPATVLRIHGTLKAALSEAMRAELVHRNVAMLVRTQDSKNAKRQQEEGVKFLSVDQAQKFLKAAENHPWREFFIVSLMTGLRRGEVCALKWADVDMVGQWLRIHNAIIRVRKIGSQLAQLKTGSKARRDLRMTTIVRDALVLQLERQRFQKQWAGNDWREQDFVFTNEHGDNWYPDTATRMFQRLLALAEMEHVRLHDLRHSCASILLSKGVHPKLVQEQLGHSRIATTLDLYSHMTPQLRDEAADAMEDAMTPSKSKTTPTSTPGKGIARPQ